MNGRVIQPTRARNGNGKIISWIFNVHFPGCWNFNFYPIFNDVFNVYVIYRGYTYKLWMVINTNEKHWWKYNWRENRSTRRKTCPIVNHSVHHKSHKEFHAIEPGRPRWQNLTQTATTMPRLRTFNSFATRSVLRRAVNQLTGPSFFILLYTQSHLSSNALDLPFNAFPLRSIGFIVPNNTQPVRPGSQCMLPANVRQDID